MSRSTCHQRARQYLMLAKAHIEAGQKQEARFALRADADVENLQTEIDAQAQRLAQSQSGQKQGQQEVVEQIDRSWRPAKTLPPPPCGRQGLEQSADSAVVVHGK
jgi:enoyl-CoA hydratase/carnithine racemase